MPHLPPTLFNAAVDKTKEKYPRLAYISQPMVIAASAFKEKMGVANLHAVSGQLDVAKRQMGQLVEQLGAYGKLSGGNFVPPAHNQKGRVQLRAPVPRLVSDWGRLSRPHIGSS